MCLVGGQAEEGGEWEHWLWVTRVSKGNGKAELFLRGPGLQSIELQEDGDSSVFPFCPNPTPGTLPDTY